MKTATDHQANVSMALLFASFILVLGIFMFLPRAAVDDSTSKFRPQTGQSDASKPPSYQ